MSRVENTFDVFLSHTSLDKASVETIARRLVEEGQVRPFLDAWDLVPGEPWQERLEQALADSATCAVFLGPGGLGPWANEELRLALDDRTRNPDFRVIPVLLPGASPDVAAIPRFLRRLTWCDFRVGLDDDEAFARLLAGIRGRPPGPPTEPPTTGEPSVDGALFRLGAPPFSWERSDLVDTASRSIRSGRLPVVLRGLPGIGKTTLLCQVAREVGSEFEHVFATAFDGPSAVEPAYVLEEMNSFLNRAGRGGDRRAVWEQSQESTFRALALELADLDALVLLDAIDLAPSEWQRRLLVDLARIPTLRVAATVQHGVPPGVTAHVVAVPPLAENESLQLIDAVSKALGTEVDADRLLEELPAGLLSHPQALVTLLAHLRDLPLDLLLTDHLPDDALAPARLTEQAVASLDDDDRRVLALVGTLSGVEVPAAMQIFDIASPTGFRESVALLQARSLIHRRGDALEVPALVRAAIGAVDEGAADEATAKVASDFGRAIDRLAGPGDALRSLAEVSAQVACNVTGDDRRVILATVLRPAFLDLLNTQGLWKEYTALLRVGLDAPSGSVDRGVEVELGSRLARKLRQMGDVEGGYETLGRVEQLIGADGDSLDHAKLYAHRALLRGLDDDSERALADLIRSRDIRELHDDAEGLVVVHKLIGNVYLRRKEYASARAAYDEALRLPTTDATEVHRIEAETSLGVIDLAEGQAAEAEARLRAVIGRARARQYPAGIARGTVTLALALETQDRLPEALAAARDVVAAEPADPDIARAAELLVWRLELEGNGR